MSTEKPRFTITMDEELLQAIDDYKFEHRIKNQSKAIVQLARIGLEQIKFEENEKIKNTSDILNRTSEVSKDIEAFELLLKKAGLLNNNDVTENDLQFLESIFGAIKSYFQAKQ